MVILMKDYRQVARDLVQRHVGILNYPRFLDNNDLKNMMDEANGLDIGSELVDEELQDMGYRFMSQKDHKVKKTGWYFHI